MAKRKKFTTRKSSSFTNEIGDVRKNEKDETNEPWSKSKKKRMRKLMKRSNNDNGKDAKSNNASSQSKAKLKTNKLPIKDDSILKKQNGSAITTVSKEQQGTYPSKTVNSESTLRLANTSKPKSALQKAFHARLLGSRFRELNEELYTTSSNTAYQRFQENPELFNQYHQGFRSQVKSWPVNPVDVIQSWLISLLSERANDRSRKGGRIVKNVDSPLVVADFGCGDAILARKLLAHQNKITEDNRKNRKGKNSKKKFPFIIHSFDLVANENPLITPCDMANVPLGDETVDVGVFALSLMGTNIADFIREAHRVLTADGILKIAEVRSRFESTTSPNDGNENDRVRKNLCHESYDDAKKVTQNRNDPRRNVDDMLLRTFLNFMEQLGFHCTKKDRKNRMFILLEFKKVGAIVSEEVRFIAKPCIYKRR